MERSTIFQFGKPSISIRAINKPWRTVSHNQRVPSGNFLIYSIDDFPSYKPLFIAGNHREFPAALYLKSSKVNIAHGQTCIVVPLIVVISPQKIEK